MSVGVTSSPANGAYYVAGETITTRLSVPQLGGGNVQAVKMRLNIGGTTREAASTSSYSFRMRQVNFSYTVVAADVDADGISIPASAIVGADVWRTDRNSPINLNNAALPNQGAHKVFGGSGAYVSATNPASLTESALNGATVTVTLVGLTYASGVSASSFSLATNPTLSGLSVSGITGGTSGSTAATLTLATASGFDFDVPATLAVQVAAAAHSGSGNVSTGVVALAPTDEAPTFGSGAVSAKTYYTGTPIAEFQAPAATGGNGALSYAVSGLPAGLVFDADGAGTCPGAEPREFCGTPTTVTSGQQTVTVTAQDADANRAAADQGTLTFQVEVRPRPSVTANPATLTEANLDGARLTVTLPSGFTFASGVSASSFALATSPTIAGLSFTLTGGASGTRNATLTLATGTGYGFSRPSTLAVRVLAAAHSGSTDIDSATLAVSPTPGVTLSRRSLTVQEDPNFGGGTNRNRGTYTVVLDSPPICSGSVFIIATSDNADVTLSPGSRAYHNRSGTERWNNPRTFTVTAAQDGDNAHDTATISHSIAANCGDYTTSLSLPSVTVNVNDDEAPRVAIASTNPASLTEANLHTATVTVALANATFASDATASSFALLTDIRNVSVSQVSGGDMGTTSATLTLSFTGDSAFAAVETLAVQVPAAAHTGSDAIETGTVVVTPTPGIALSRTTLALEEDPTAGGGTNANVGTYTVALTADPTIAVSGDCAVNLRATSNNADVALDAGSPTPLRKSLEFDGTNWSTPQTVMVTAGQDGDGVDDVATISITRPSVCSGGFFGRPTLPSVTVNVNDDETPAAAIASPTILTAATLNNATLTVSLERTTYASGVTAAGFELVTEGIAGAAVSISAATATAGGTSATLTLASSGVVGANATLAVRVLAAAHAGDTALTTGKISVLQGADTAPTFGSASVPGQFFRRGVAIAPFQIPAATGGNGAIGYYSSTQTRPTNRSLPAGLKFDATGTDAGGCTVADFPPGTAATWATAPRTVCGTPTSGALTRVVTIVAFDADSNRAFSDEGYLFVTISILAADIASTTPSPLTESSLHGATVQVQLGELTSFASGVTASSFELVTAIPDVSISGVSGGALNTATATLTLAFTGDFSATETLAVKVLDAAHNRSGDLTTNAVSVFPTGVADTAPTFGSASVPGQFFRRGVAIAPFQIPAATGGNGAIGYYSSTQTRPTNRSLPAGLKFDATGTDAGGCTAADFPPGTAATWATAPRTVCGTPTSGALTRVVTIVAFDADSNRAFSDEGYLFVTISILAADIASTTPSPLTESSLHGATVQVQLGELTSFASGVTASSFELVTAIPDVSISGVSGGALNTATATLTLAFTGDFSATETLAVKVLDAAHNRSGDLTTNAVSVFPTGVADTAPTFGSASVPGQFFRRGVAIAPFQIPAATGGNGAIGYYSSTQTRPTNRSLPAGLKFDATGTDAGGCTAADFPPGTAATWATAPRTVCGTPTSGALTRVVTIVAFDADSNRAFSDEGYLFVTISILAADIASTTPSPLTESSLHGATVQVQLGELTSFASGVTASSFELVTAIPDVSISGVSGGALNTATATLTLAFTGDFSVTETLAVKVLDAAHNRSGDLTTNAVSVAPTDTAPAFAAAPAREFLPGVAIAPFQVPAATGGNGEVAYTIAGLPAGLKFDATGTDAGGCTAADFPPGTAGTWATAPRTVCGTPTRNVVSIVVVSAEDEDGDTGSVQFRITVAGPEASIASTTPAALAEGGLNGATLTVSLARTDFAAGLAAARFALVTTIPDLRISGVAATGGGAVAVGATEAVLTLAFTGDFGGTRTLAVRVLDAAHGQSGDLTTGTVDVTATAGVTVGTDSLALNEPPNAGTSGTYTLVLDAAPPSTCSLAIGVTGGNADVAASPGSLTFTDANWDTPQTVTVTASADADSSADADTLAHAVTASTCTGYPTTLAIGSVAVTVADADVGATIAPSPAALTESNLHGATLTLTLDNTTFAAGAQAAGAGAFALVSTITGLTIAQVSGVTSGGTTATLTLGFTGDFRGQPTLAVRVPATTHQGTGALTSNAVAVTANAGVTVSESSLSLDEDPGTGGSAHEGTYTVVLDSPPTGCALVRIDVASSHAGVTVSPAMLTFRRTGAVQLWNAPQTVTVTAGQDDDGADVAATVSHSVGLGCSAAGYIPGMAIDDVAVAVDDDETPGILFDADPGMANDQSGPLELDEDQMSSTNSDDYTVRLAAQPTQTTTVTITSGDTSSVTVDDTDGMAQDVQNTLTFTATNWNTPQTVTLTAQQDDDGFNESVTLAHAASTATTSEYANVAANFTASVDDDETPAITLSSSTLSVPEADDATYTVRLATEPEGGSVTVAVTGAADGLAASPTSLTFTAGDWDTARTVTVTAAADNDGTNETATFRHTASGADYGTLTADLEATATDDDAPSLRLSRTQLTVAENSSGTYTIHLNSQPTATVTVTVSGASGAVTVDTAATSGDQNTLTFTNANWGTAQTVTVAAGDDGNAVDETPTLSHTATGGDYAGLPAGSRPDVQVTVDDDDTAGILLDADPDTPNDQSGPLALNELPTATNNSVSYTARLSSEPTQDATVTIVSNDAAVTVDDTDGDSLNGVQNTLTFTSTNWNTPQTVTLTAADDNDGVGESATITHTSTTASASEYANLTATITANTTDDDAPAFVFDADPDTANDQSGPLALEELQSSATNSDDYTVRLSAQPTQTVTATITSGDTSSVTVGDTDTDTPGDQNTLTFTSSNWNTPQTVTLTAQQDDNGFDESVTIAHAAATTTNSEYRNVNGSFTASVNDDETPAITLSATMLTVPEENSRTYTVRLATEPVGGSVTVDITGAENRLSASPTRLVFTAGNWDTARTVTVTAANDNDGTNDMATFSHAASGADYGSVPAATIVATSTDDDAPSLQVSTTALTVDENSSGSYTIRLNTQPSATVTVTVSGASGAVTVDTATTTGNQNTLTFTTGNWATAQTVTVAAGDDGNAVDEEVSLTHTASGGDYASLALPSRPGVTVTVTDNDTAGIILDADPNAPNDQSGPLALAELSTASNNSASYTVRLSSEPTQTATVAITSNDTTAVTVDDTDGDSLNGVQNTLTFTNANWNTPQTVTLTAAQDNDGVGENVTITHTASTATQSEYTNLQATITANTTDAQAPGFVFDADPSSPATNEAGPLQLAELSSSSTNTDDYTVRLTSQPTQTVTATITSSNTLAVTVDDTDTGNPGDQNTLTFTSSNWNTPQTVTLTAQQDDNGYDESVTIAHAAATTTNSEYRNVNGDFTASVNDDETPAITLSTTTLSVQEQNSATYTVRLATEPVGGNVTVDVTGAADGLSASPTRLIFTTGNWDTERTVRMTAANDQDGDSEVVTFSHAASGADYGSVTAATIVATSTDNDTPSLQVTPTTLEVDENGSGTYRVRLNTQPTGNVTVTVSGATGAVTVDTATTSGDQNTLTFTTTTWSAQQTVTVEAGDDGNAQNEMLTLTHTASGGGYGALASGARPSVQLTVDDDDTAGILIDADPNTPNDQAGPLALNELSTASNKSVDYTVRLSSEPTQDATVTITSNTPSVTVGDTDGDSMNGVQNTLTFTSANWNTPRTVTLTAAEDDNGVGESATITHTSSTSSASEYTNLQATLTANTTDDDVPSFVFDADPDTANDQAGPLALNELSSSATNSDDYTVRLYTLPTRPVTVTITSNTPSVTVGDTDGDSLNGVQNTLTFTATNWATPQTVTLTAQQDDNGFDESATITHSARTTPNSEYTNVNGTFMASVNDDETPAITLSTTTLTVPEQTTASYTVRLATEPVGGAATVDITGAADGLSASPTRLIFTTANWDTQRTVRVTAANDLDGDNETVTFTHTASGADYGGVPTAALVATSTDNDTPSLQVTPTTLEVDENASGRYRIRLNTQPSATVTVTVSGATGAVTVDTSTTSGDQNTLTFTTTTWSAHQTVTVSAGDDGNAVNEMLTLSHAASGGDYGALGAGARPSVQLTVDDDDMAGIVIDADPNTPNDQPGPLALAELSTASNNSVDYTVRLSSEPTQDATVTITSNDAAVTVDDTDGDSLNGVQNTLTFTSTNWNTPQTVTLTAAEDDNGVPESATITHTSATATSSEYTNLRATLTANTTDDDAPSFVFDADPDTANDQSGPLALNELSSSTTNSDDYTVRLYTQPTRTVTATIASNTPSVTVDTAPASGNQNTLTFTSSNWNTPQTVTLTAQQDDNGFDESATITHRARTTPNSEYTNVNGAFTASVTDDETPAITLSASTLTVPEQNSATYTVRLATEPVGGNATVTITGAADGIAPNPTRLVFTAGNWDTPRTVRVSAANDNDSTNEVVTLSHAATGADYGSVPTAAIVVTATDDDTPSLNVSPTRLTVRENRTATYTMRLNTQPSAAVTVSVSGTTAEVTVDETALTFTTANWNAARTITVSAADDDNATDETVNLLHAATGGDYTGLSLASRPGVEVSVDDDDTPALAIDPDPNAGPLALNEMSGHADNAKDYTVRLATQPTAQVEVAVSSDDRAVSVDNDATPRTRTLTFTTTNWATAQAVTATAAEDDDASNETVTITHAASGGDYEGVSAQLRATTVDDDAQAIAVAASALVASGVAEGGTATYTVRLETEPEGAARVSVAAEGPVSVDLDRNQAGVQRWLRFDATNWNTPRTALVRGSEDADAASGTATLRHTGSGADYGRAPAVDVSFAVTDDDTPQVLADATTVEVNEGSTAGYSVTLAAAPTGGTVEVTPTSSDEAVATISPTTLRFTASNWNAPQRVTVRGVSDGAANITHPTTGADYGTAATPTVAATVRDEDAPGVRVEPTLLRMEEGGTAGYRVRLNTEPAGDVTVTATSGSSELTLQEGAQQVGTLTLTFTTGNWNAEQQVRAQSIADDDVDDDSTTVGHTVAGYAGVSSAPTLAVEVEDADAPGLAFDPPEGLALTEGGAATGTYTAVLAARPTGTVTVAVSSDDAGLAVDTSATPGDQTELTFTTTNWNDPQTVTARAELDADAATEEATLLHAAAGGGYDDVTAEYAVQVSDADAAPAPARVQASSAGTTSLAVSWSASPGANGYWVQWRTVGGEWSLDRLIEVPAAGSAGAGGTLRVATGPLSARIDGLREGVVYEVRVLGLIGGDPGDPSPTASATPRPRSPAGNRAPEIAAQPEIVLLEVGGQAELDLAALFREPEGDALTYSAASTNSEVATATLAGTTLRIFAARPGNAQIAVTAEDPQGLSTRLDIRVGVIGTACSTAPAQAPEGGTAIVTAELASAVAGSTTVRWRIMRDTNPATADADAADHGGASGEVEIRAGERCAEIEIPILNDTDAEPAREWFDVELRLRYNRDARLAQTTVPVAVLEGVCDRTPQVRRALMAATDARGCEEPAPADLRLVRTLDLSGARLSALATEDLGGLTGLRTLNLSNNALTSLPALPEATRLEHLLLGGNALESAPLAALPAPERLRSLSLPNNALAEIPPDAFATVPGLRSLRLDGNQLQTLPNGLFAGLSSLRLLRLDDNPGAPFALRVDLERTDAEPWALPPATLRTTMPLGAPFETVVALAAEGGTFADGAAESQATVPPGATASAPFTVDSATGFARVSLTAPELPPRQCLTGPCWQGFALEAGDPLALFARQPRILAAPEPAPLFGDGLRVALSSLAEAGEPAGELEWSALSSDPTVATVRILGGHLLVEPEPGAEGAVTIEATATDAHGQTATVRFDVRVEFHWPTSPTRGWRGVILNGQR